MQDDPRKTLKWMEQELLAEDRIHRDFSRLPETEYQKDDDLLELVDQLLGEEDTMPELIVRKPAKPRGKLTKGERAERARMPRLEESAAVLTKTKKQLRQEAKQQKIAEKKASVNRKLGDLVFLAVLECVGILVILGWWLQ